MKTALFATFALCVGLAAADCHADNCANHITGTFAGIGVPISARISLCNDFLKTTVRPPPRTVTTTVTKLISKASQTAGSNRATVLSPTTTATDHTATTTFSTFISSATSSVPHNPNQTITQSVVPTFATAQCPENGQFASACKCWARVTPRTSSLPATTVTVTTTVTANVACSPAATEVSNETRFPCSNGWGMCSCLRTGDGDGDGICVRVGTGFFDGGNSGDPRGRGEDNTGDDDDDDDGDEDDDDDEDEDETSQTSLNVTGPCWFASEYGAGNTCRGENNVCVFDNSCPCGKRRCYKAVAGCDDPGIPSYESKGR